MAGIAKTWLGTTSVWRPIVILAFAIVLSGCPVMDVTMPDGNGDGTVTVGPLTARIDNFTNDTQIVLTLPFVSVLYNIENASEGTTLSTFFVPVIGVPPNVLEDGDRVIIDEAVVAVSGQGAFEFVPANAGSGNYLTGITITASDGTTLDALSDGRIMVEGVPAPQFILPLADTGQDFSTFNRGDDVIVTFDAGDPENNVQWRVFFIPLTDCIRETDIPGMPLDELGTLVGSPGSGNVGAVTLSTADLAAGCYQLGISATDSGSSIATTVDRGQNELIVTVIGGPILLIVDTSNIFPPSVSFTAPGASAESITAGNSFLIQFDAIVTQPGATGMITVFFDGDRSATNGFTIIMEGLIHTDSPFEVALPTTVPEGIINIGAAIDDGVNPVQFNYAVGTITITK